MSYQALYRKYRPSNLEDVIGQDVVIKILKNSLINNKIGHAYLFSGPRGIGKTTIAKSFAKAVNCLNLENGCSCEKCENCLSINSGFNPDIIEIDAASNNGVDEIREIKNKINLMPNQLKYKVYIIDEVHMLSIGAFNALLKTLEEPPEHIIFILATTDPQKIPSTIISRCQCFEFHRISNENIVKRLKMICENENIKINDEVLLQIAILSDGGLRDSIGMLDKLNSYSNNEISIEDFEKINGIVSLEQKNNFIDLVYDKNIVELIEFIDNIYDNGKDLIIFIQDLIQICKNSCIKYYLDDYRCDIDFLLDFSKMLSELIVNIKTSSDVKTIFEISLLSFINKNRIKSTEIVENVTNQIKIDNEKNKNINKTVENDILINKNTNLEQIKKNNKQIINNCFARAKKQDKQMFENSWKKVADYALDSNYGAVASLISDGVIRVVSCGEVIISFNYDSMVDRGLNLIKKVQKLLQMVYNINYDVAFITNDEWNYIKEEYIANKNNGIEYKYVPLNNEENIQNISNISNTDNSITSKAIELFGDNVIKVE